MRYTIYIILFIYFFIGCNNYQVSKTVIPPVKKIVKVKTVKAKIVNIKKEKKYIIKKEIILPKEEITIPTIEKTVNNDIAIIYASKKIGKYAIEATNTAMVYLINDKQNFSLKMYDIEDENENTIYNVLNKLKDNNISKVLFLLTSSNVDVLFKYDSLDYFNIYLPLINATQTMYKKNNIIFGGINYLEQFKVLLNNENNHIVEIYDNSSIGKTLHLVLKKSNKNISSFKLSGKHPNFAVFLNKNKKLINSTLILNTPIIKSSIILSQLRANEIEVKKILSSQINYTPLLLTLTQKEDRRYLTIANYIDILPKKLEAINILLGNDILYNWVNYSVVLGMEYLKYNTKLLFDKISIKNNQVVYSLELINAKDYNFSNYESTR